MASPSSAHLSFLAGRTSPHFSSERLRLSPYRRELRPPNPKFRCSAGQSGFFTRLGRLIKEKAKSDVEKVFSGFSKTRENLAVIDELLLFWNLAETDRVLDELEEVSLELHHHLSDLSLSLYWKMEFSICRRCWFLILDRRLRLGSLRGWGMI